MRWGVAILVVLLAGCRHQPLAYTLRQEGRTQLLTPPVSKPEIKKARSRPAQIKGCDVVAESFSVEWHGNTARVGVKTEVYFAPAPPPGEPQGAPAVTIAESGPRMFVDSLAQLETFRDALAAREDSGCFRDEESLHLRQAISEAFPFPPQIAVFLRFGTYTRTGYFDLVPDFVLRLVSPAAGEPDVSFYEVKTAPGGRMRITLASGAGKALAAPEESAYFRYLYWTGGSTHSFRTTILGVPERAMLRDATDQFLANPDGYCAKPGAGIYCQSIAVSVGMNAGFYVRINGKDAFIRLGGELREALGEARNGMRLVRGAQPVPQNVTVRRLFHGKLIPIKVDGATNILSLVAMPGDDISSVP
jgi:hypothetical protein